jgi:hypothetical protein
MFDMMMEPRCQGSEEPMKSSSITTQVTAELSSAQASVTAAQRRLLEVIAQWDRDDVWAPDGCRDYPQWLAGRLGISTWAARRWINAAHTLPTLRRIAAAFVDGTLSLDKVTELCRFATPETEGRLISWARRVTVWAIRRRADLANRPDIDAVTAADDERFLRYWWYDDGNRLGLEGSLGADQGAVVATALDRVAGRMPEIVTDHDYEVSSEDSLDARRADALVALASAHIADDHDPDRATLVVHAPLDALIADAGSCEIDGGPVIDPETARRLCCDCRLETVFHDASGVIVGIGRASRNVSPPLLRALRRRDRGCTFPGCGARCFLRAHHIRWWGRGGPTDLDNLVLVCHFHHKLVHEHGWDVRLGAPGTAHWFRPNGTEFDPSTAARQGIPERAPPTVAAV